MDWLAKLLTDVSSVPHIILVYSLVIAVGALLGRIRLFGVSLGVTFVLFAAIAAVSRVFRFRLSMYIPHDEPGRKEKNRSP